MNPRQAAALQIGGVLPQAPPRVSAISARPQLPGSVRPRVTFSMDGLPTARRPAREEGGALSGALNPRYAKIRDVLQEQQQQSKAARRLRRAGAGVTACPG